MSWVDRYWHPPLALPPTELRRNSRRVRKDRPEREETLPHVPSWMLYDALEADGFEMTKNELRDLFGITVRWRHPYQTGATAERICCHVLHLPTGYVIPGWNDLAELVAA